MTAGLDRLFLLHRRGAWITHLEGRTFAGETRFEIESSSRPT